MKTSEFTKYLKKHNCILIEHGSKHDLWKNIQNGTTDYIPRHQNKEIPTGTIERIKSKLGLK